MKGLLASLFGQNSAAWEDIPVEGRTLLQQQARDLPDNVEVTVITSPEDIANKACAFGVPTFYALEEKPCCFLKLEAIPPQLADVARAGVERGGVRLKMRFKAMASYPIIGFIFHIPVGDDWHKAEAIPNLTDADVRTVLDLLLEKGEGKFYLLEGEPATLVGEGAFSVSARALRSCLDRAAGHYARLKSGKDYDLALNEYVNSTTL